MDHPALDAPKQPAPDAGARLLPIPMDSLDFRAHDLDMYLWHQESGKPALYRAAGIEFTAEDAARLAAQSVRFLYIPAAQHEAYRRALTERLERRFADPAASQAERARVVREACTRMIEDVLLLPDHPEPIAAVSDLARQFCEWSERDPETFSYVLQMSDHDFYTTTHMVNVGVGCGLLGARLRPNDSGFVAALYQGGLLHDIGKRDVPADVLNKEGHLSDREWELVRRHPELGHAELARCGEVAALVLEMTRDHHERLDGAGYPGGRGAAEISLGTRICTVVDVFDALTSARPYRGPMPPANALTIMEEGVGSQFDEQVFAAWRDLVAELLQRDPGRARPADPDGQFGSLAAYSPRERAATPPCRSGDTMDTTAPPGAGADPGGDNRRRFERHAVCLPVEAEFARQLKTYPIGLGERFSVRTIDISRTGLQVETPWPLAINDLLVVHLTTPKGPVSWRARVARVRAHGKGWSAGLQILGHLPQAGSAA